MYHENSPDDSFLPLFYKTNSYTEREKFHALLKSCPSINIIDLFASQKKELIKSGSPQRPLGKEELEQLYREWLQNRPEEEEGVWVFYPWNHNLIHILDEHEFIHLRTIRNRHKITASEHETLLTKKIGIVGLSVGHAVALTVSSERICSHIKLADFDTLELGNLNRIRTGIHNYGLNKCIVTAREIAEIDPFIKIECYTEGLSKENIENFLLAGGKLDILVDECDDLEMKINCRIEARRHRIPVIMETSDRGMLDVERFDLTPERPIFHGILVDMPMEKLQNLSPQERIPLVLKLVNAQQGSPGGKASMLELGRSIPTWPQLSSAVTLGGAAVTDVTRRILLSKFHDSGRYYIDFEQLVQNESKDAASTTLPPFDLNKARATVARQNIPNPAKAPDYALISQIVEAACQAPSYGNFQPWKWIYNNGRLFLFFDHSRDFRLSGINHMPAYSAFGAATENIVLQSHALGWSASYNLFPTDSTDDLAAVFSFNPIDTQPDAGQKDHEKVYEPGHVAFLFNRPSDQNSPHPRQLEAVHLDKLEAAGQSQNRTKVHFITTEDQKLRLSDILSQCELISLLNANGHDDFFNKLINADANRQNSRATGINLADTGYPPAHLAALSLLKDPRVAQVLKEIKGGSALTQFPAHTIATAQAVGVIFIPDFSRENLFEGGVAMQRLSLTAAAHGFNIVPVYVPALLFSLLDSPENSGLDGAEIERLEELKRDFSSICPDSLKESKVAFIFRIAAPGESIMNRPECLPLSEVLFPMANPINR